MPISPGFSKIVCIPICPPLPPIYGTPFHVYDEVGIRETGRQLQQAFASLTILPRVLRGQGSAQPEHPPDSCRT
jgi:hypothetical protein